MPTLIHTCEVAIANLADAGVVVRAALMDAGAVAVTELNDLAVVATTALERLGAVVVAALHDRGGVAGIRARRSEREHGGGDEEDGTKHGGSPFWGQFSNRVIAVR